MKIVEIVFIVGLILVLVIFALGTCLYSNRVTLGDKKYSPWFVMYVVLMLGIVVLITIYILSYYDGVGQIFSLFLLNCEL